MAYIHSQTDWPKFTWDAAAVTAPLAGARMRQGLLLGRMQGLGFKIQAEATLESMTQEVVKSSEIEGETLPDDQVRSSLAARLGLEDAGVPVADRRVEGVVDMMVDASRSFTETLTADRLFAWHRLLFASDKSGVKIGAWRDDSRGPMQVVSGPAGRPKVHYEAPAAARLDAEMEAFLKWENGADATDAVLRAGLAHLWFVTLHPFEDGNGRIARAIADRALARADNSARRFYSMSAQIRKERKDYYDILERTQRGPLDVTEWLLWFLGCLERAFQASEASLSGVLERAEFWHKYAGTSFNERQRKVLALLLDRFEGKLTSSKWAKLAKCSQDTAHRDIMGLVEAGILAKDASGGRSTAYFLVRK